MSADGSVSCDFLPAKAKVLKAADLFCGASGMGTGAKRACAELGYEMDLVGINHWETAIATSRLNHPRSTFLCSDLNHKNPLDAVPGGYLDLLLAAPSCVWFSRARGGKPVYDQQRTDPWIVVRWCTELRVKRLLLENVPEIMRWGPCDARTGRPIKSREGEYFRAWIAALEGVGFKLDYKVVCCADYGDATTRERFLLMGRSDGKRLRRPEPTHARGGVTDLLGIRAPWRPAAEIIDWSDLGTSIFDRKKPLVAKTVSRLLAGAKREYWPRQHVDALQALLDGSEPRLIVTAAEAEEIAERFGTSLIMATGSGGAARSVFAPIPTITTGGASATHRPGNARPHFATPVLLHKGDSEGGRSWRPVTEPAPTATGRGAGYVATPIVAPYYGGGSGLTAQGAHEPVPAITTKARFGLATPFIIPITHTGQRPHHAIDSPLKTITGANRGEFALAQPAIEGARIDALYRMLRNRELARATSFDDEGEIYQFAGTATDVTRQIGNAVPCRTVQAHVRALLEW